MPIKFGLLTNPSNNIIEEIKLILKLGFDYVEVGIELPEGAPEIISINKDKISKLIEKFNYPALAHTAWWIDFGSGYAPVRRGWVEEAKRDADVAKSIGIKTINFHFYSIGLNGDYKPYHKQILSNIINSLKEVVKYANSQNMTVMLENAPLKRHVIGINEYKFVIKNIPDLKVHLDIGHAFVENGMKSIKEYISTFADKLEHVHLHDNHGESDEHLPLGVGNINFEKVAKWLKEIKYDKAITFEVFTSKQDAKGSMLYFRDLLKKI